MAATNRHTSYEAECASLWDMGRTPCSCRMEIRQCRVPSASLRAGSSTPHLDSRGESRCCAQDDKNCRSGWSTFAGEGARATLLLHQCPGFAVGFEAALAVFVLGIEGEPLLGSEGF